MRTLPKDAPRAMHGDVEIVYNELEDRWDFEVDGRSCRADTLDLARKRIMQPPPKEKKKFERFFAWFNSELGYRQEFKKVIVTSVEDHTVNTPNPYFWTQNEEGKDREKVSMNSLYVDTEENAVLRAKYLGLKDQIASIEKSKKDTLASMKRITMPDALK